jgi:YihY family inner membrane protein
MILLGSSLGFGVIATVAPDAFLEAVLSSLRFLGLVQATLALLTFLAIAGFLALLYRYSLRRPNRKRRVWAGAFVATFLGSGATVGLGFYATNIARYALFYGGLAAIVVILLWLWLWSSAILIGAEINVALEDVDFAKRLEVPRGEQAFLSFEGLAEASAEASDGGSEVEVGVESPPSDKHPALHG